MTRIVEADLCVIGAGSGGLSVAAGAAQMGAKTVLIEKGAMGGDCLNTGCVPSKSLLAAAHAAHVVRTSGRFGVNGHEPDIDFAKVHGHVHGVIASIAPHDSVERFEGLGVTVIKGAAHFTGLREATVNDTVVRARRFVLATGSSAFVPPIDGIDGVPYLTNESVFELTERPDHLIVIGAGPIGMEMAQAFRRLGSQVTVLEAFTMMPKDDPELVDVVRTRVSSEGIDVQEGAAVQRVEKAGNGVAVVWDRDGAETRTTGSHLLVATGRRANVHGLNLEAAGIAYSPKGVAVDNRLRTSNKRVFAIGDVIGGYQFTHVAGYHAGIVIRNALFRLPAKVNYDAVPWVTYTDPELAHVGLTTAEAEKRDDVRVLTEPFSGNDRACAEGETDGLIKVSVGPKGRILGASIAGPRAGELITPWTLAVRRKLKIGAMADVIAPYPTLGEISKRVAGSYYTPTLFGPRTRRIVGLLQKLG